MAEFFLVVTEGILDMPVAEKLLSTLSIPLEGVSVIAKSGRRAFWRDAWRYNQAARSVGPVFGLADLESFPCPSGLIAKHLPGGRHPDFVLRIAERMLESWLLADTEHLATFLGIGQHSIPRDPDSEPHAKQALVNLARKSPNRELVDDLVPESGSKGIVGRGYTPRMTEFVNEHWSPLTAGKRSESLRKAIAAIRRVCDT
jgi:hypothetical protein